jgi:predicted permease
VTSGERELQNRQVAAHHLSLATRHSQESNMPDWKEAISKRLAALKLAPVREAEIVDELAQHLEDRYRELLAGGLAEAEAYRMALGELSEQNLLVPGLQSIERAVTQEPVPLGTTETRNILADLWQDFRYGWRILVKNPGFTVVAVLTLALGIGVNTTIFSLVSSMLLRKPPVHDPDRLMMMLSRDPGAESPLDEANRLPVSAPDFLDWRAQATSFSGIAALSSDDFTLSGGTEPERVPGATVSADYFQVLDVPPVLGRAFVDGEDQAGREHVVVLRKDLWKRRFGADERVIGRAVRVNGENYTVIGVMPDTFRGLWLFPQQLWIPLVFTPEQLTPQARRSRFLSVFARLKAGVTKTQARAELATVADRVAAANPQTEKGWTANLMTVQDYAIQESNAKTALLFLTAAVGFVLLIACANLANLLLARNSNRQREFAIRRALGAGGFRLARQLLSECFMLALLGGGMGLLFSGWGLRMLRAALDWNEYSVLMAQQLSIDASVLLFTFAVSVAAALVFGLAPALQLSRGDLNDPLKESSRSTTAGREHHRLQSLLVMAQLALSLILLVGAGLFVLYFVEEIHSSRGMNPRNLLTASVSLSGAPYKEPRRQATFFQSVLRQLESFPDVQSAAVASDLPFTFPGEANIAVEGRPVLEAQKQARAGYFAVSPGYFSVTQIPLREGREFTLSDSPSSAPVVIVNEAFARQFFPNQNPLGRRISINREGIPVRWVPGGTPLLGPSPSTWSEVVGVVGNVNEYLGQDVPRPHIFEPFLQRPDGSMNLVVRLRTEPGGFGASLRRAVWNVDKDQPVTNLRTMGRVVQDSGQGDDLMAELMGAFAGLALLMASVGIYGLIAYLVRRRTHEMGVRMALGARQSDVFRLVLRGAMSLALTGVALGFVISLALPKLVAASFSGFHVHATWIVAGTPLAVTLVALASCYLPARRASRVDPMAALRYE